MRLLSLRAARDGETQQHIMERDTKTYPKSEWWLAQVQL
jgi:hypothetical protein